MTIKSDKEFWVLILINFTLILTTFILFVLAFWISKVLYSICLESRCLYSKLVWHLNFWKLNSCWMSEIHKSCFFRHTVFVIPLTSILQTRSLFFICQIVLYFGLIKLLGQKMFPYFIGKFGEGLFTWIWSNLYKWLKFYQSSFVRPFKMDHFKWTRNYVPSYQGGQLNTFEVVKWFSNN